MGRMHRGQEKAMFARKIPKGDLKRLRAFERKGRLTQDERFERDGIKLRLVKMTHKDPKKIKVNTRTGMLHHMK